MRVASCSRLVLDRLLLGPIERFERGALCKRYNVSNLEVGIIRYLPDHIAMLDVIGRAVALLEMHNPSAGRWLRLYVRRILVLDVAYAAHRRGTLTCVLSAKLLQKRDVAVIASKLVHEATHGRFTSYRYIATKPDFLRMENRCIAEQAAFLRTLHRLGWNNADEWARFFEMQLKPVGNPVR